VLGDSKGPFGQQHCHPNLVYEALKDKLSVFGNYMNGFNNISGVDINSNPFKPEYANQMEFGVKGIYSTTAWLEL
jgi:iron complex outermembrane receptor protein